jgi:hypothetical protein
MLTGVSGFRSLRYLSIHRLLGNVQTAHAELEVTYELRLETGTTTARTSPSVPATTADPPRILTLKYWALRKA